MIIVINGKKKMKKNKGPRILYIDIETKPILAWVWGLFDQNIGLDQIKEDWGILSWAAKWADEDKVMYQEARHVKSEKRLMKQIWKLMDKADIIIGQNSKRFDVPKLNAKFFEYNLGKPSSFQHLDTLKIAGKNFSFTSFKLEYMTHKYCKKFKKLTHKKFPGFKLHRECMLGNPIAWLELKAYNIMDILSLEELYNLFKPWDNSINYDVYHDELNQSCSCGNKKFKKNGFDYTASGRYQRYKCSSCGRERKSKINLVSREKLQLMKK